jgi:hypothetical protein
MATSRTQPEGAKQGGRGGSLRRGASGSPTRRSKLKRATKPIIGGVKQPNWLQLKASEFSETMFEAGDEWDASVASDAVIQAEKEKLLVIHSRGVILHGVKIR